MSYGKIKNVAGILVIAMASAVSTVAPVQADEIDDFIEKQMASRNIPGLQLAIVRDNKIVKTGHYGYSNLQDSIKVSDNTLFPINSMTKAFTGVAIMQLVEQGKIAVDDPVSKHLSDLPQAWRAVTIKQLLAHTSGLPLIMSGHFAELIPAKSPEDAFEQTRSLPMRSEPNTRFEYNQTGYILLGQIIDKHAGMPFVEFITQQQLNKVPMPLTAGAGFGQSQYIVKNQARQYFYGPEGRLENYLGGYAPMLRTAAGMSASATELASYSIALRQGKLFKTKESLDTLWQPARLNNGKTAGFNQLENGYAMGWQTWHREQHPAISASGGNASSMVIYPEDDLTIIVTSNKLGSSPVRFIDEIAGFFIPQMKAVNGWGLPKDIATLYKALQQKGFEHAIEVATRLQKTQGTQFDVNQVNDWGYRFVSDNQLELALEVFKLNVHLHPEVANAWDSLAETYLALGDKRNAKKYYQKVLQLAPGNAHATKQLEAL